MSIRPVKEYEAFGSRSNAFNRVMAALDNDNVNIIGVYEMGEKLGLKIEERSVDLRAARLHNQLKKINKVLIILDDIWEEHDLDPLEISSVDKHKGLKILMTSRRLESKANKVAQKCAGLPITIATVAKALKHKKNLHEWEDALEQLKPSKINFRELLGAVYSAIEMSYKYLKTEDLKSTLLLCNIMGHNAAIEDLLKYCTGLGLFHGLGIIQKVRNRVLTLVSELEDSFLLLVGSTPECFNMHDVICDVAISITSRDGLLLERKMDLKGGLMSKQ
ncbi:hypothetical protein J1N35_022935 [Gossypium stocksii]|uniref:NB-ARC domain-containing protein n=1 Tax=Gossypium stocksii TaxID=47602 RepID=A0A9D3VIS0_9ROSI|nr:hypothetical protein J1N35_022935 [Gossypium stocksii]